MSGGFKTVSLEWANKIAVIGYACLFVYEIAQSYEARVHVPPTREICHKEPDLRAAKGYRQSCLHS